MGLTFVEFQEKAKGTAVYPQGTDEGLYYAVMGLAGEAGEVANKVKKLIRDGILNPSVVLDELGDVLWYCAAVASELDGDLSEVAQNNLDKLYDRLDRGVVQGSGDDR